MGIHQERLTDIEQRISQLENQKLEAIRDLEQHEKDEFDKLKKKNSLLKLMIENNLHIVSGEFIKPKIVTKEGDFVQYIAHQELKELTKEDYMTETKKKIFLDEKFESLKKKIMQDIDIYKRLKNR